MIPSAFHRHHALLLTGLALLCGLLPGSLRGQQNNPPVVQPVMFGPYNADIAPGGPGLRFAAVNEHDLLLEATSPWTMSCWFQAQDPVAGLELVAGMGDVSAEDPRYLALTQAGVALWMGERNELVAPVALPAGSWHFLLATSDGSSQALYVDGKLLVTGTLTLGRSTNILQIAPPLLNPEQRAHFGGKIAAFTVLRFAEPTAEITAASKLPPSFALLNYELDAKSWAVQNRAWSGYTAPQAPGEMPVSKAPLGTSQVRQRGPAGPSLQQAEAGSWSFGDGWTLEEAPKVSAAGAQISNPAFNAAGWMRATVPGTVLTSMIDDGIYPDPDYGLNNLAIPESLNKQDYWYRNEFGVPVEMRSALKNGHVELTFEGINYAAEVWLNGARLGTMKGAFRRGTFDVSTQLRPGKNVLAIRVSPPPHPGIPQEQSMLGGPGENGGQMELDGPTFLATEGWDWIPAVRDRDTGIWQPVKLTVTHGVQIGDPQVITTFPNHNYALAQLEIAVPLTNQTGSAQTAVIAAQIGSVTVHKSVTLAAGLNQIKLTPAEFKELSFADPRLWWPNGYGKPELYDLKLTVTSNGQLSDTRQLRFGMREVSYELSLLDASGHLKRVQFTPANATGATRPLVDVSHQGMRKIPGADAIALNVAEDKRDQYKYNSVVSSLAPGAERSPAIQLSGDLGPAPYLVIVVNGVKIAARGGNWGMDDSRKRVSREHLEPFFRLDRDANLNIIRNWVGQNTEEVFYQLADEYGMMIWNDFWESTQDYNLEAEDPQLFLANAEDTIRHFRNHPSIILWCGRNEGVPQPILNNGLEALTREIDGTRFYSPSSNQVNLQQSGPYSYQDPTLYFTSVNRGFSVETGTPSMATLESFKSTTPPADQWPMDDVWAYHDWHFSGNGDVHSFMDQLGTQFGAPTSLADFERKAQMLNYVDHRAIFEGMNANLWTPNSGRMLWMTQPAWPSTVWQILSSDYDTQASFYGTKKACEPLHAQLNLATNQVDVVNTTPLAQNHLTLSAQLFSLANTLLFETRQEVNAGADSVFHAFSLAWPADQEKQALLLELKLTSADGKVISRNVYWLATHAAAYRSLNKLPSVPVGMQATTTRDGEETVIALMLSNKNATATLANKLTLLDETGQRILPAYYSDNYVSLLPNEEQRIEIRFAAQTPAKRLTIALRGWNTVASSINVAPPSTRPKP